jgi:hypothetical protein
VALFGGWSPLILRCYGASSIGSEVALNSPNLASPKCCENVPVAKRNRPSAPPKFLYELEIAKRHDDPALVGIEEPIDFRLADWLLECDAGNTSLAKETSSPDAGEMKSKGPAPITKACSSDPPIVPMSVK